MKKQPGEQTFSSNQIAELAGVSLRQLQWWDEREIIQPNHVGHQRAYSPAQAVEVLLMEAMRAKGISTQRSQLVLKRIRRLIGTAPWMLTDGHDTHVCDTHSVIQHLCESETAMFLIPLADLAQKVNCK